MSKSKKRNIIIGSLCAIVLLMAVGYAAFQTVLNIEGTSNITSSWDIKITNVTSKNIKGTASNNGDPVWENLSATFKTNLQAPGDSIEYDITVTNNGNLNAKLDKYKLTDTNNEAIKFTQTGLTNGEVLTAGSTKTFTVKVEYLSTTSEQPSKVTSSLTITLDYSQAENGYTPGEQVASEQLTSNLVTSGDGLYEDTYEPGRYVYKGANPNNYITFNNEEWRIISVEADGTLKIIKNDKLPTNMFFDESNVRNEEYCSYPAYGCNVWGNKNTMLNSMGNNIEEMANDLSTGEKHPLPQKEATLNTYLNTTYYNSLAANAKSKIDSHLFYVGVVLNQSGQTLDIDSNQEKANMWNGKIGLISVTDYIKSSTNTACTDVYASYNETGFPCKTDNYLYENYDWWTISPYSYTTSHAVWHISSNGYLYRNGANNFFGVRPTLYLKSDIILSGAGDKNNPYVIK